MIFVFILLIPYVKIYEQSWERVHMVLNASRFEDVWDKVLSRFERETDDKIIYNTYFLGSKIIGINEGVVTIVAPSRFACQMLNNRFFDKIVNYLRDITQTNFDCQIIDPESAENFSNLQIDNNMSQNEKVFVSNLNQRFTFENFVVGHSNRECYTAALSTAMDPGNFYNPLFMYGKSGLGKTHLLHAIGNFIKNKNNLTKVLYLTADDFFEDYIKTVKKEGTENLKDKYRGIDVLLLDDIQFLRAKNATQETFFNIFNLLVNSGKQIVITADKPPQELEKIETRLVGRFSSGLSVEIQALEFETALAILKKKVEAQDINRGLIDDDVLKYIAQNYSTDVRQLEGALNKLLFYAITYNKKDEIDMTTALETFKSFAKIRENTINFEKIKVTVAEYYNISINQLTSKIRQTNLTVPRHIAMYLCKTMLNAPYKKIGEEFGGKDHSTVISACEKVNRLLKENEEYVVVIEELKKLIKS